MMIWEHFYMSFRSKFTKKSECENQWCTQINLCSPRRKLVLDHHRTFIWILSNSNYTSSTLIILKKLKYFSSGYFKNIIDSKVFSPIFDLIDVKLTSKFYPKWNTEWTYNNYSGKLGTHILITPTSLG